MKQQLVISLVLLFALGSTMPASAEMCALDNVPAATLLVPYFEVSLGALERNTIVTVNNATSEPTLAHLTTWSDWGVPIIDFDLFLTGYDVQVLNLYDMFSTGNVPITADAQSDPLDTTSPAGDPSWDGDIENCHKFFPFYFNPLITGNNLDRFREGHSGQPGPGAAPPETCYGSPSPSLARGYITFDVAERCSLEFPSEPRYFGGLDPVALDENRIFGDVSYFVFPAGGGPAQVFTLPLVHIEADPAFDANSTASGATFYGRYAAGGIDNREPLGSVWDVPVHDGELVTSIRAWRDSQTEAHPFLGYPCDTGPEFDLGQQEILCWNDQEDVMELCSGVDCFPTETQSVAVDSLSLPWESGWCRLDLRSDSASPSQSWVGVSHDLATGPTSALPAISVSGACSQPPVP